MLLLPQEENTFEVSFCPSFSAGTKPRWDGRDSWFGSPESRPSWRFVSGDRCGCRARLLARGGFRLRGVDSSLSQPQPRSERLPHSAAEMARGRGEPLWMFATRAGWLVSSRSDRLVSYRPANSGSVLKGSLGSTAGMIPSSNSACNRAPSPCPPADQPPARVRRRVADTHAGKLVHKLLSTSA